MPEYTEGTGYVVDALLSTVVYDIDTLITSIGTDIDLLEDSLADILADLSKVFRDVDDFHVGLAIEAIDAVMDSTAWEDAIRKLQDAKREINSMLSDDTLV